MKKMKRRALLTLCKTKMGDVLLRDILDRKMKGKPTRGRKIAEHY